MKLLQPTQAVHYKSFDKKHWLEWHIVVNTGDKYADTVCGVVVTISHHAVEFANLEDLPEGTAICLDCWPWQKGEPNERT